MSKENKQLNIYFVLKSNYENTSDASISMKEAFQNSVDWNLKPQWISEIECVAVNNVKGNVIVFEEFDGKCFQDLLITHRHSRIVGPSCLLRCFNEQMAIPHTPYPVFNMAMHGLIITASVKPSELKTKIETLVGYMGGNYLDNLTSSTTHLVVSGVLSEKYLKANENGIPVLKYEWIEEVWKRSLNCDIKATEENILNEYKCPIFHKLVITTSQLNNEQKMKIKRIVVNGGGKYSNNLEIHVTNILIAPSGQGQKHKYAVRWKIPCLYPAWLDRCVESGYSVRYKDYVVGDENKCSTPVSSTRTIKTRTLMDTNDSDISIIPSATSHKNIVEETTNFDSQLTSEPISGRKTPPVFKTPTKSVPRSNLSHSESHQKTLENISVNDAKRYQHLLDGCNVYLSGFTVNEEEKLKRVLKYSGAIRYTELNESVTHVIVGNPTEELETMNNIANKPHIVKLDWLCNSLTKGCLEKESNYAFLGQSKESDDLNNAKKTQQPSPLSKKGLQILNPKRDLPVSTCPAVGVDQILIEKYSNTPGADPDPPPDLASASSSRMIEKGPADGSTEDSDGKIFDGLTFLLSTEYSDNQAEGLKSTIVQNSGRTTANIHSYYDYILVPFIQLKHRNDRIPIVTSIWLDQCLDEKKVVNVEYYHKPITPVNSNSSPLENNVITFSSYNEFEKQYLKNLAYSLGAKWQDVLAKKDNVQKGILKTTHLVSLQMQGSKYDAAKKWNLPIVGHEWLRECFRRGIKLPIDDFLLEKKSTGFDRNLETPSTSKFVPSKPESSIKATNNKSNVNLETPSTSNFFPSKPESFVKATNSKSSVADDMPASTSTFKIDKAGECSKPITSPVNRDEVTATTNMNENSNEPPPSSKLSNTKRFTTPSVTEAIQRAANKNASDKKLKITESASNNNELPTGFILKINECPTSGLKRKFDGQVHNADRTCQTSGPRRKMLKRHDNLSSPYEEVGWQDTLTDISNNQLDNVEGTNDNGRRNKEPAMNSSQCKIIAETVEPLIQRKFLISLSNNERKLYFDNIIKSLGGIVLPSFPVDSAEADRASHMIIDVLKKTEKLLCSIASGLWVLHPSYLEECKERGKFIEEEKFEWGNPLNERLLAGTNKDHKLIANAAHRWRRTIETGGANERPFVGMKAVIISAPNDEAVNALTRVVKSGGGITLQSCEILSCTHCIVNKAANLELIPVPLKRLIDRKIHCVPSVFLSDHLMNDPPPDIQFCYFDAYKRLFKL